MIGEMRMRGPQGTPVLSSREGWEDGTYIRETMRSHWGHELKVVEAFASRVVAWFTSTKWQGRMGSAMSGKSSSIFYLSGSRQ